MLATMSNNYQAHQSHRQAEQDARDDVLNAMEDRVCPGCKLSAVSEQGGLVVAFGSSFFHVDCFKCAKCGEKVTADTNLLLLSDGSPICANCSYSCNICRLPILDEAIMTGDDSYHAHCFKCKVCKNRIDELVFAKTSQGIYCMDCHNERMIKIRKHNEKKAAAAAAAAAGGSTNSRHRTRENERPAETTKSPARNGFPENARTLDARSPSKQRLNGGYVQDAFNPSAPPSPAFNRSYTTQSPRGAAFPQTSPSAPLYQPPPRDSSFAASEQARLNTTKQNTLPTPAQSEDNSLQARRRSYDDGTRPLDVLLKQTTSDAKSSSLPSKTKRRSINPGLVLSDIKAASVPRTSPTLSPLSASSPHNLTQAESPKAESPQVSPRPISNGSFNSSNYHDNSSSSSQQHHGQRNGTPSGEEHTQTLTIRPRPASQTLSPGYGDINDKSPSLSPRVGYFPNGERRRDRSASASRPSSRQEVPRGVGSGTDTDPEEDPGHQRSISVDSVPPAPPPKEVFTKPPAVFSLPPNQSPPLISERPGQSESPAPDSTDSADDMSESSPVEERSHATFIAPALPPIRISMGPADFADIFSGAGSSQSNKSLQAITEATEALVNTADLTPPPTASSFQTNSSVETSRSDATVIGSVPSHPNDDDDGKTLSGSTTRSTSLQYRPSTGSAHSSSSHGNSESDAKITVTAPESEIATPLRHPDGPNLVFTRLSEALADAKNRGAQQLKLDRAFVEAIIGTMDANHQELATLRGKMDGIKRASKTYIDGLTVAQGEYDRELKARRDAEAEVTRLRVLLSGQAARLTAMSGDSRREELRQQMSKDLNDNLSFLEHDISELKVKRDLALAEVEELSASTVSSTTQDAPATVGRSLTVRLDKLKSQYQRDLVPLTEQREALQREIKELKAVRDVFLEETTALNARNEELAQLNAVYSRRMESVPQPPSKNEEVAATPSRNVDPRLQPQYQANQYRDQDDTMDLRYVKVPRQEVEMSTPSKVKFMKWGTKAKDTQAVAPNQLSSSENRGKPAYKEHSFQQLSILRLTRCDCCGDKMWGSQLRCTVCNVSVHTRCINNVQVLCSQQHNNRDDSVPLPPSMFGRDLVEQVQADSQATGMPRHVPIIVEKCLEAVEQIAMDYEGIYRKTGGSGQSRMITQLFERGDYDAFDLCDSDRFNDICSVTSVLKTYFRNLPTPLLTYDLHDQFMSAVVLKDIPTKNRNMAELVDQLPDEHYATLQVLMLHLHRVFERSEVNLMSARNLGVVFGPTLMRSRDPAAEFSDMAGKALSIEWLVENAPLVFGHPDS